MPSKSAPSLKAPASPIIVYVYHHCKSHFREAWCKTRRAGFAIRWNITIPTMTQVAIDPDVPSPAVSVNWTGEVLVFRFY